ncbi:MAG: hypothetical protein HZB43_08615 [candidate division Zixibacteria bacterium]|nr:hypothetical protein [candidate division Zixibacteria bacterium]
MQPVISAAPKTWDYIPPIVADAATQMAIDAELADLCNLIPRSAYLRFYRMSPPAVTIGRHQSWRSVVDPERCRQRGWDWVRRPTGGGALLHRHELNYAVALSHDMMGRKPAEPKLEIFARIAAGLMAGLSLAGFEARLNPYRKTRGADDAASAHGLCGASLTRFEITVDGFKSVAAAQCNLANASLQHGTIYMSPPAADDRFWPEDADPSAVGQHWWAWSKSVPSAKDQWLVAAEMLKAGLSQNLGIEWRPNTLDWPKSPAVVSRTAHWEAEQWHHRR